MYLAPASRAYEEILGHALLGLTRQAICSRPLRGLNSRAFL